MTSSRNKNIIAFILRSALLVGTLDILAAFISYYINTEKNPLRVLLFIASGVFGKKAYTEGNSMMILGLLFHYIIAFAFTAFFVFIYPRLKLSTVNRFITGVIYGIITWLVMNFVVVPLSKTPSIPFNALQACIAWGILIIAIGLPLSFLTHRYCAANTGRTKTL